MSLAKVKNKINVKKLRAEFGNKKLDPDKIKYNKEITETEYYREENIMNKTTKFTAIVLAVVLALSCFTVAFATGDQDNKNISEKLEAVIADLKDKMKPENVKKSLENMNKQAEKSWRKMYNDKGEVVIPQAVERGNLMMTWLNKPDWNQFNTSKWYCISKHELMKYMLDNPILNQIEEWSLPPLTWVLNGIGDLMDWERPGT